MSDQILTQTIFESFDLHPLLLQGLDDCGFTRCTRIQELTLPVALAGRDVAGQARTGTGKTCAFLVAVMNHLLTRPARAARKDADPRALVIAPTRELAIQIDKDARAIGARTGLTTALIYGGVDYDKQRQELKNGCDIIIATPGRLLDYYKQHVFRLDNVEVMVVDEADRMFDLGFIKDVRYIFHRLPPREERQVLLYSATLSQRVLELAYEHMNQAEKLVVETETITAERVRQQVYFPAREEKVPLLLNLLEREKPSRALVFVNTRHETDRVRDRLRRYGYRVGGLSGDVPQVKRQKLLQRFKDGDLDILVCTDVAARGLHIPHVSHVFNYDLPQDAEDYVHRIGRTARLGEEGDAISFACDLYAMSLPDIEAFIEQKIPVAALDPELLHMPKAPPATAAMRAEAADDANDAAAAPPRKRRGQGGEARPRGRGGERRNHAPRTAREAPPPRAVAASAVADTNTSESADANTNINTQANTHTKTNTNTNTNANANANANAKPEAAGPDGARGPRKRHRHRGGRRAHHGEQTAEPIVRQSANGSGDPDHVERHAEGRHEGPHHAARRPDRRSQPRRQTAQSGAPTTPPPPRASAPATPPPTAKRPGFLRRLFGNR